MTRAAALEQLAASIAALRLDHPTRVAIDGVEVFDYRTDRAVESPRQAARRDAVLLFDGVFLSGPELQGSWDLTVWLDVPFEVTVERAVARDSRNGGDAEVTRGKYEHRYVPGQRLYLSQCRPQERADIVVDNTNLDRPKVMIRGGTVARTR